jgi:predicted dehydrogenase
MNYSFINQLLRTFLLLALLAHFDSSVSAQAKPQPLKIGIAGLTHTHVHWLLGRPKADDITIVGIVEPNRELAKRYTEQHGYLMNIVYNTMEEMIAATQPEAVCAFGTIYDHLKVVETCAPLGIHVMVEKPLAVSMEHAKKMKALANKHKIHLLTNYETTWHPSNHKAFDFLKSDSIGSLKKVVVHDGHKGPKEIGVNKEFLDWLTDPVLNGGGALTDFGCYGANLVTWLSNGAKPVSVFAITQTLKPEVYPKVDDEATIVVEYPTMQAIIQASWNWPVARKDMEVYGVRGYFICENRQDVWYRLSEETKEQRLKLEEQTYPYNDPFALFAAVIRKQITLPAYDLSSLENNMLVMELLEAAKKSAKTGKRVYLRR